MKRFSFVAATILILWMLCARLYRGHKRRGLTIRKGIVYFIVICFIALPVIINSLLNDNFQSWFYNVTGMDINTFMLGRFTRLELVANNLDSTGLGSTTTYLTQYYMDFWSQTTQDNFNLHNDIFKIFAECGILGTSIFTIGFFKATKLKKFSVVLMVYLMLEMIFNHLLGAGTVQFWIMVYLILFILNRDGEKQEEKIAAAKRSQYSFRIRNKRMEWVPRG